MPNYTVTASRSGIVKSTWRHIHTANALEAVNEVEAKIGLSEITFLDKGKNKPLIEIEWSGYILQARRSN